MALTQYAPTNTRTHWAGAQADRDIHIEALEGGVDGSFRVTSMFRGSGLTNFVSVAGRTNVWRGDRMGAVAVQGRRSGEKLNSSRVVNEKFLVTVDTTSYIRSNIDYQDDWTAPNRQADITAEHGSAHAKSFDTGHIIQLIKCGDWLAPADLKASGAFYDGIKNVLTGYAAAVALNTPEGREAAADLIVQTHKAQLEEFTWRDLGDSLAEFVTLMEPSTFNMLLNHNKLMNVEFQGGGSGVGNNFASRRVAMLNGIRIIETPRFPRVAGTHALGPAFETTAADVKAKFITFHPGKTLVTVEAKPMEVRVWDDKGELTNVLDSFTMYTVGIKRGDACAVAFSD